MKLSGYNDDAAAEWFRSGSLIVQAPGYTPDRLGGRAGAVATGLRRRLRPGGELSGREPGGRWALGREGGRPRSSRQPAGAEGRAEEGAGRETAPSGGAGLRLARTPVGRAVDGAETRRRPVTQGERGRRRGRDARGGCPP